MNRLPRAAVVAKLADRLREQGSWCGETHLQKAAYLLEEMLGVPLGFEFILYKHGPFSFEVREELAAMRADGLLELEPRPYPYGPTYTATGQATALQEHFPKTVSQYEPMIAFVAEQVGDEGVVGLEKLATALYVTKELGTDADLERRAARIREIKRHVSLEDARDAVERMDKMMEEAKERGLAVSPR